MNRAINKDKPSADCSEKRSVYMGQILGTHKMEVPSGNLT